MSPLLPRLKSLEQFPSSRDGTQRLEQTAWHCVIRPHWPPRPLLPSSLPSPEGNLHQHPDWVRQGSTSTVFYWPPPHTCLSSTSASSPPAVTAYLGSVLPSAFPLQAESEALPRTPTTLGQELQKHQAGLVLVSLPASLPADCGLATEAGHWDHRHPLGAGETCGILSPL